MKNHNIEESLSEALEEAEAKLAASKKKLRACRKELREARELVKTTTQDDHAVIQELKGLVRMAVEDNKVAIDLINEMKRREKLWAVVAVEAATALLPIGTTISNATPLRWVEARARLYKLIGPTEVLP